MEAFLAPPFFGAFFEEDRARRPTPFLTLEGRRLLLLLLLHDCFSHPFRHLWAERTDAPM